MGSGRALLESLCVEGGFRWIRIGVWPGGVGYVWFIVPECGLFMFPSFLFVGSQTFGPIFWGHAV